VNATQLVGRGHELGLITSFLDRAAVDGGALLLSGAPGLGKTVLLDAAAAAAAQSRVLRGAGVEFEADVSFAGLSQILLPVAGEMERLGCPHRAALQVALGLGDGPAPDRLLVSNAALALLRQVATLRPVVVIVDDLQWLDRPSASVLGFVARRLAGSRAGFLAAARSGQGSFLGKSGLPWHEVPPLDAVAAADLVSTRFPVLPPRVRERVLAEAQGNPLALLELPTALTGPQRAAVAALPAVLPLSRRLQAVFASQIGDLPEGSRELLLLAVLDGTGDLRILQTAADIDGLGPAEQARLVQIDQGSGRLTFRHPLTRSAIVDVSSCHDRRRAHQILAELADQPERRAWHLAEAAAAPDEQVAVLLEQVAQQSLHRGDAVGAVTAMLRAAELSPRSSDRGQRLATAAYVGADVTGDLRSVERLLAEARRADPDLSDSLPTANAAAYLLLNGEGDVDTAHRLLAGAVGIQADREGAAGDAALLEALHTLLLVCFFGGRAALWEPLQAAIDRLGPAVPVTLALEAMTFADPVAAAAPALSQLDAAISGLRDEADPARIVRTGIAADYVDRLGGCREALWRVVHDGRKGGAVTSAIDALFLLCADDWVSGRWDEAHELAGEGLALCEAHGYQLLAWPGKLSQGLLAAARGDSAVARALADEMSAWALPRRAGSVHVYACHIRALDALGRGDFEDAYQHAAMISPAGALASHVPHALLVAMDLVEAAVRTGRQAEAAAHVTAMHAAGIAGISDRLALVSAGSAALTASEGAAGELFGVALAVAGADRWPFDLARIQLAYGEHLRRVRAAVQARQHLAAALGTFRRLGARPWMWRASNELRAAGWVSDGSGEPGPASLTPQEREIAVLAAAGLTNKQIGERLFLSPRTIGSRLYRIFPKLGIASRAALHDALDAKPAKAPRLPGQEQSPG
jgi:DNA-binding CsgD family transcriptional regulator